MRRIATILGLGAALTLPAALHAQFSGEPRSLMPQEKARISETVRKQLSHPEQARFRWYKFNGSKQYCGLVDARSEAGESLGWRTFLIDVVPSSAGEIFSATNPIIIDPDNRIAQTMTEICLSTTIEEDAGEPIDPATR